MDSSNKFLLLLSASWLIYDTTADVSNFIKICPISYILKRKFSNLPWACAHSVISCSQVEAHAFSFASFSSASYISGQTIFYVCEHKRELHFTRSACISELPFQYFFLLALKLESLCPVWLSLKSTITSSRVQISNSPMGWLHARHRFHSS